MNYQAAISILFACCLMSQLMDSVQAALGKKGHRCRSHKDCDQLNFLACNSTTSICDCPTIPSLPLYYSNGQCLSYIGGICSHTEVKHGITIRCVEHGKCVKTSRDPQEINGICICEDGFVKSPESFCNRVLPNQTIGRQTGGSGLVEQTTKLTTTLESGSATMTTNTRDHKDTLYDDASFYPETIDEVDISRYLDIDYPSNNVATRTSSAYLIIVWYVYLRN